MVVLIRNVIKMEDGSEVSPDNNTRVAAMDWQVADSLSFDNIVLESLNDTANLSNIAFTDILDPNAKWFARARALIKDHGWTVWGNLDVMVYQEDADGIIDNSIPSKISTPILTTTSNPHNHDATLFDIIATGFYIIGNAAHVATSWFIEDINDKLIWSSIYDTINRNRIEFSEMILKNNSIYRIRAMFHSSSNDVSSIACYSIRVGSSGSESDLDIWTYLDNVDYRYDYEVQAIVINDDIDSIDWQILSTIYSSIEIIYSKKTTGSEFYKFIIPAYTLEDDTPYILRIKAANIAGANWKYVPFRTLNIHSLYTIIAVYPKRVEIPIGETATITVVTEADDYDYAINDSTIFSYDKSTSMITGLTEGSSVLIISAKTLNHYENYKQVDVIVTSNTILDAKYTNKIPSVVQLYGTESVTISGISTCKYFSYTVDGKIPDISSTKDLTTFGESIPFNLAYTDVDSDNNYHVTLTGTTLDTTSYHVVKLYGYATEEDMTNGKNLKLTTNIRVYVYPADTKYTLIVRPETFIVKTGETQTLTLTLIDDNQKTTSINAFAYTYGVSPIGLGVFNNYTSIFTAGSVPVNGIIEFSYTYAGDSSGNPFTTKAVANVTVKELNNYNLAISKTSVSLRGTEVDTVTITTDAPSYKVNASSVTSIANVVNDGKGNLTITGKDISGSGNIVVSIEDDYGTKTATISLVTKKIINYSLSINPTTLNIRGTESSTAIITTTSPSYTVNTTSVTSIADVVDNGTGTLTITGKNIDGAGVISTYVYDDSGTKTATLNLTTVKLKVYTVSVNPTSISITGTASASFIITTDAPKYEVISNVDSLGTVNVDYNNNIVTITGKDVSGGNSIIVRVTDDNGTIKSAVANITFIKTASSGGSGGGGSGGGSAIDVYNNAKNSSGRLLCGDCGAVITKTSRTKNGMYYTYTVNIYTKTAGLFYSGFSMNAQNTGVSNKPKVTLYCPYCSNYRSKMTIIFNGNLW